MSEIKRYDAKHFGDFEMIESPQGEWVRWEDMKQFVELAADYIAMKEQLSKLMATYAKAINSAALRNALSKTLGQNNRR